MQSRKGDAGKSAPPDSLVRDFRERRVPVEEAEELMLRVALVARLALQEDPIVLKVLTREAAKYEALGILEGPLVYFSNLEKHRENLELVTAFFAFREVAEKMYKKGLENESRSRENRDQQVEGELRSGSDDWAENLRRDLLQSGRGTTEEDVQDSGRSGEVLREA
jgi:hypothetical protein